MSPDSYIFSHLEKHWNHWEWHLLFVTSSKPLPKYEPDCMYPTSLNHTTSPLTPLGQFLRALWNAVPQATVFISPPIKLNHNSHIVLFFFFFQLTHRRDENLVDKSFWQMFSNFSISLALQADNQYQITMGIHLKLAIRAFQGES